MGGSMKGHSGGNYSNRTRQYAMMLILAIGAAILGVMLLHKLRERRIFNLLVKEKDQHLLSLHLLLQKERDHNKEAKTKIEEMKSKMYSVRTKKMELNSRILEMQSTISSLKDELKTLESALEEKQNEIKFLREKEIEPYNESPKIIALAETLKQKEAEINELKRRLEFPAKIWSVSSEDPSSSAMNSTGVGTMRDEGGRDDRAETTNFFQDQVRIDEIGSEKRADEAEGKKTTEVIQDGEGLTMNEEKGYANSTETISNGEAKAGKEEAIAGTGEMENFSSQGDSEAQQLDMNSRGGMKLERKDDSSGTDGVRKKNGSLTNQKEKKWRILANARMQGGVGNGGASSIHTNKRFRNDGQRQSEGYKRIIGEQQKQGKHQHNYELAMTTNVKDEVGENTSKLAVHDNHQQRDGSEMRSDNINSLKPQNSEYAVNTSGKDGEVDVNQQIDKGKEINLHENGAAADANKSKVEELEGSEGHANGGVQQRIEMSNGENGSRDDGGEKVELNAKGDKDEDTDDSEVAENREAKTEVEVEVDEQGKGKETDEPEF